LFPPPLLSPSPSPSLLTSFLSTFSARVARVIVTRCQLARCRERLWQRSPTSTRTPSCLTCLVGTHYALYSLYTVLTMHCTHYALYSLYTVLIMHCTHYTLYSLCTALTMYCTH
jgi:hypothetical protein